MGAMKNILNRERMLANQRNNKRPKSKMSMKAAGTITASDVGKDLLMIHKELRSVVFPKAVDAISTQVRKTAVRNLKSGGGTTIGMSKRTGTRGSPLVNGPNGPYFKNGWSAKVVAKRGANKPSMAQNGGKNGSKGIITKTSRKRGGYGITGPIYGFDDKQNSRVGYNHAHTLEFGAPGHKKWGKKRGKPLPARPFLGPAAEESRGAQIAKLKKLLRKWGKVG
jgi:hypothetical protein